MSYPQDPNQSWNAPSAGGYSGGGELVPSEDRNWAVGAHIGSILTAWFWLGLLAPLIVMLVRGPQSPWVRRQAVESLNFQINAAVLGTIFALSIFVVVGFVLLPLYIVFYLACVIMATVAASKGREYRYPLTVRIIH